MRITRYLLLVVLVLAFTPSVFACRECLNDCVFNVPPPTNGCMFTQDGCTDGNFCFGAAAEPVGLWTIVSVDVTHSNPVEVTSHQQTEPVFASAKVSAHGSTAPAPTSANR